MKGLKSTKQKTTVQTNCRFAWNTKRRPYYYLGAEFTNANERISKISKVLNARARFSMDQTIMIQKQTNYALDMFGVADLKR